MQISASIEALSYVSTKIAVRASIKSLKSLTEPLIFDRIRETDASLL